MSLHDYHPASLDQHNTALSHSGRCLCGAVVFSITPAGEALACHCTDCRRHHGIAFHSISTHDFRLLEGAAYVRGYASSSWAERGFCTQCGTGIYYHLREQNYHGVSLGCLDEPKPMLKKHIYVESAEVTADKPYQPAIWDDLPQLTGAEFLRSINMRSLADNLDNDPPPPVASLTGKYHGGCHCGGVRFCVHGDLQPVSICHCGQCQKQSSGYYRASAIDVTSLTFEQQKSLLWYASSTEAKRGFCRDCGSILFWRRQQVQAQNSAQAATIFILTGAFDARLPLPVRDHIFTQDASAAIPLP